MRAAWLQDAIYQALLECDIPELDAMAVKLAGDVDTRMVGAISPSLVAKTCALSRMKTFLGQTPVPGVRLPTMAITAGRPHAVSAMNMLRGFWGERLVLACLQHSLGRLVLDMAPSCRVDAMMTLSDGGSMPISSHPDCISRHPGDGSLGVIQIKTPSTYKLDRIEKEGEADAWASYLPQVATEMYACRAAGFPVQWGALCVFSWDASQTARKPHVIGLQIEWEDHLASFPEMCAEEINRHLKAGTMPEAMDMGMAGRWPCSYCPFSRVETEGIPACDNHGAWLKQEVMA